MIREKAKQTSQGKNSQEEKRLKTKVQADTFTLKLELNRKELTIILDDYINWKTFKKVYKGEDIGKEISGLMELEDIYYTFVDQYPDEELFKYKFGTMGSKNGSSSFNIEKNGKITVHNKIINLRGGKQV